MDTPSDSEDSLISYWLKDANNIKKWEDRGGTWEKLNGDRKTNEEVAEEIRRMIEIDPFV
ncbi:MAG TPA: hypothetical protein DEZ08_00270 [Dehalococcoidia bacterium]|jgi:hypothetical protein|nr:hypothetical protein [Dehalococcoidia bacterium]|tara:strand:+ start:802 stop:981 length:180 start_codon:yes stop_codon:yes gene_type:complete